MPPRALGIFRLPHRVSDASFGVRILWMEEILHHARIIIKVLGSMNGDP